MEKRVPKKEKMKVLVKFLKGEIQIEDMSEYIELLENEIELLEKKSSRVTPTKNQKENEIILEKIVEKLRELNHPVSITELQKEEDFSEYSNQKLSSLMKKLVDNGIVNRVPDKKKVYFELVKED